MSTAIAGLRRQNHNVAVAALGTVAIALAMGIATSLGYGIVLLAVCAVAAALLLAIHNWRWAVYGLVLYLPLSGIPIIALYPHTALPNLFKDFLFVLPAYIGFAVYANARRESFNFPRAPVIPLALLALIVLAQAANPALPNHLVGVIGVKIWLLYVPLYFLAYHFVGSKRDLFNLLGVVSLAAILPLLVGVLEATLIYSGRVNQVYGYYGEAAGAVTQNFAQLDYQGASLRRVPSLFSSATQYYGFTATMVAITYAWWRAALVGTRLSWYGFLLWALTLAAAFLSGARAAFLLVPLLVIFLILFQGGIKRIALGPIAALVAAVVAAGSVLEIGAGTLAEHTVRLARYEFGVGFVDGFRNAFELSWGGLGSGIDSAASRYAFSQPSLFPGVEGTWYESWYVKVMLELGIPGLILVVLLFGTILWRGFGDLYRVRDPQLRVVSAAILAFLAWALISSVKGQYLDFDPVNVYFWLFAGVLAKIAVLDRNREDDAKIEPSRALP